MTPDVTNAAFEAIGAALSILNIRSILKHGSATGVSVWPVTFFTVWGGWNAYYYSYLTQPWSAIAALAMFSVNAVWLSLMVFYRLRKSTT